ncbi:MAG TPA: alpha-ketoacid dehydrogenase subunit beta [Gaiellaceae bacterium]|nr:alpha-ketoacid dehydrogenase subunit beta [Gaiellaceae bacterium]
MSTTAAVRSLKFWQALNEALVEEMERDAAVVLVGQDVAAAGGTYGVTRGLATRFGEARVRDTPISEAALAGLGVGSAAVGLRPIVEIMFFDFTTLAMDQIVQQAAKFRYFTSGRPLPVVFRTMCGAGAGMGAQHSQSLEAWFCHVPGLTVVMPSGPADAKGLLKSAIRLDDPVLFIETAALLTARGDVPDVDDHLVPLGVADVKLPGEDVTLVALGRYVDRALAAAEQLAGDGVSVEVVDPRTLQPLDLATLLRSVRKTGRLVVAHEAPVPFGVGAEICAAVAEQAFDALRAPVRRVGAPFTHVPVSQELAELRVPSVDDIVAAVQATIR